MGKLYLKGFYAIVVTILFTGLSFQARAQFTTNTLATNVLASAMTRDAAGNIYVVQIPSTGSTTANVVKYAAGTNVATTIATGISDNTFLNDHATGIAVASNGDVYVTTDDQLNHGEVIKLTASSSYSQSVFLTGSTNKGYYSALAMDASDNLYVVEYYRFADAGGPFSQGAYEVAKYNLSNAQSTVLYDLLDLNIGNTYATNSTTGGSQAAAFTTPTGLAVNSIGDVYVADSFNSDGTATSHGGAIYKLTKASGYAVSTVATTAYCAGLAVDALDNLYATRALSGPSGSFTLVKYTGGAGSPATVYTPLNTDGNVYPSGIAVINSAVFYLTSGDNSGNEGNVLQIASPPATQAFNVAFTAVGTTSATVNWTNGSGAKRAVFISNTNTGSPAPVNSTTYNAASSFWFTGSQIAASSWYCIYNGTGTSVNITGLTNGATYRVMAVEYNGSAGGENYLQTTGTNNPANVTMGSGANINSLVSANGSTTNSTTLGYNLSFSPAVSGSLTTSDFTLTKTSTANAVISSVSTSDGGNTFNIGLTGVSGNGTLKLNFVSAAGLTTPLATALPFSSSPATTIDNTAPTISIGSPSVSSTSAGPVSYTVNYADANFSTSTLSTGDITLNKTGDANGTLDVTGSGTTRTVTISSITGNGTLGVSIGAGTASDLAGNTAPSSGPSTTFNVSQPVAINSISLASANPTNATSVNYTVTFAGPVSGLTASNFSITASGPSGFAIGTPSSADGGTTWTVSVTTGTGDGTLQLNLANSTNISPAISTSLPFAGATYTIDKTPPTLSYSSSQTFTAGTPISPLTPASSGVAAQAYGSAPVLFFAPFTHITNVATDAAGNVYVTNQSDNTVTEIPAGGGASFTLGSGFNGPQGVAVDAAGNVYVTDVGSHTVKKIPAGNGTPVTLGSGFTFPVGIAVDAAGNIYVADRNGHAIKQIPAGGGAVVTLASLSNEPNGLAIDAAGNLYMAAFPDNVVKEYPAGNGTPVSLGSGFGNPFGIAVDAASNVFVTDGFSVYEIPSGNGTPVVIQTASSAAIGVAVDAAGNLYATYSGSGNGYVNKLVPSGGYYSATLPAGLTINSNTGVISGTPTAISAAKNYTVTAYNAAGVSTSFTVNIGVVLPVTSLSAAGTSPTNASTVNYTAVFGAPITGLTASNFSISASGPSGSAVGTPSSADGGTTWTIPVTTGTGDGTLQLSLANAGGITPGISTTLPFAGSTYTIDKTAPTISIGSPSVSSIPSYGGTVTFPVTYADANFGSSSLSLANITLNSTGNASGTLALSGSGTSYTVTVSNIIGVGTLGISIAAGTATDQAGNTAAASGASATFDVTPAILDKLGLSSSTPGAAIYSLRLLASTYSGPLARIIIGSNYYDVYPDATANKAFSLTSPISAAYGTYNATSTGATANALSTVVSGATNATVAIWYDQSGNLNNSVQATTANQPAVINAGTIYTENGKPALRFSASSSSYFQSVNNISITGASSVNTVAQNIATGNNDACIVSQLYANNNLGTELGHMQTNMFSGVFGGGWSQSNYAGDFPTVPFIATGTYGGSAVNLFVNGIASTASSAPANLVASYPVYIGRRWDFVETFDGYIPEVTIFPSALSTGDRQAAESNQFTYYNIPTPTAVTSLVLTGTTSPTNAASVNYTLTFAGPVTGVTASNFSLTNPNGIASATVGTPSSSDGGTTWTIPVSTGTGDGLLTLNLSNYLNLSSGISTTLPYAGTTVTVDKTAPAIAISNPSPGSTTSGPVSYTVTYTDANFNASTLATGDITLNATGSATGSVSVSGSGVTQTVTISSITGTGTLGISLAAGTASDKAGNLALAAGPSATFGVNPPSLSYNTPQTYTAGVAITPLSPTVSGVAATGYNATPVVLATGLLAPLGVAIDNAGNVYVADKGNNLVKKIPAGGGAPISIGTGFNTPTGVAVDASGNVYVADGGNSAVKEILAAGGSTISIGSGFSSPAGVAVDAAGNVYVADAGLNAVVKILAGGASQVTLTSALAGFVDLTGIAVDARNNLYVSDGSGTAVYKIRATGGVPEKLNFTLTFPSSVAVDASGDVFVADGYGPAVYEFKPGNSTAINIGSSFGFPGGVAVDGSGNLYVSDASLSIVEKFAPAGGYVISPELPRGLTIADSTGIISGTPKVVSPSTNYTVTGYNAGGGTQAVVNITVTAPAIPVISYATPQTYAAGTAITPLTPTTGGGAVASPGYNITPAPIASGLIQPSGIAIDKAGDIFFASPLDAAVYKITVNTSTPVSIGSGFNYPTGVAVDASGNVYVADPGAGMVYEIPASGPQVPVGSGFSIPVGVAVDAAGNVFVADAGSLGTGTAYKVTPGGTQTAIASNFLELTAIATDAKGNVYIVDGAQSTVFKVPSNGGFAAPLFVAFDYPTGVTIDGNGNLFVTDADDNTVYKIGKGGNSQIAIGSGFNGPNGVAVDAAGNLYIADTNNNAIDEITPSGGYFISATLPQGLKFDAKTGVISGTPTTASSATDYTVVAYNAGGASVAAIVNIAVTVPAVPVISYATPQVYVAGTTITPLAPSSSGGAVGSNKLYSAAGNIGSGFSQPTGMATDASGNVYVVDSYNGTLSEILKSDGSTVVLGSGFDYPTGVAVDVSGNVYVADQGAGALIEFPAGGGPQVNIDLGGGFVDPGSVAVDIAGNIYIGDESAGILYKMPVGGTPIALGPGFLDLTSVAVDKSGNIYVADGGFGVGVVFKFPANGSVPSIVGRLFNYPTGLTVDAMGNVFVADQDASAVYKIPSGSSKQVMIASGLNFPTGVAVDAVGNLYATETNNSAVDKFTPAGGYYLSSALPKGLKFNDNTGVISGMPIVASPAADYSITAYNPGGSSTAIVNITVNLPAIPTLSYSTPLSFINHTAITPVVPVSTGVLGPGYNTVTVGSSFLGPQGVAVDASGNVYMSDAFSGIVYKIPAGSNTPVALGAFGDPLGLAVDAGGNVYVADDMMAGVVYEIPAGNTVSNPPVPITYDSGSTTDFPSDVTISPSGNLYISSETNGTIYEMPSAGGGTFGTSLVMGSGFNLVYGVAADIFENVYVADISSSSITKILAGGGSQTTIGSGFNSPDDVAVDINGNVFVADEGNQVIKEIPNGSDTPVIIGPQFGDPYAVAVDNNGNVYVADNLKNAVKKITTTGGYYVGGTSPLPTGLVLDNTTGIISGTPTVASPATDYTIFAYNFAGRTPATINITVAPLLAPVITYTTPQVYVKNLAITALSPGNTGGAVAAPAYSSSFSVFASGFSSVGGIATDQSGNIYFTDNSTEQVFKIPSGSNTPVEIDGGYAFNTPTGIAVDKNGNVYVADTQNNQVVEIPVSGAPFTIGSGFLNPQGVAVDASGNVYVADGGNHAVMKIPGGTGTPVAIGTGFQQPYGVALDASGNVFISDFLANNISEILASDGSTVAIASGFNNPAGITIDVEGNLFIADLSNYAVKEILAGTAIPVTIATDLSYPLGAAADGLGNLYVADGTALTEITPIGGYYLNAALPTGLTFDDTTGTIAGTPTKATLPTTYTITGYNFTGGSTAHLKITIKSAVISTTGTITALSTTQGTPSTSGTFSVSGVGLAAGILVTPPNGFEVGTDGTNFSSTVTVGAAGTVNSTAVYIRLAAATGAGVYSGNVVLSSLAAANVNVAVPHSTVFIGQTITFNTLPAKTYGDANFSPGATSNNAGIPITYASDNTGVATIVGNNIHIVAAGTAHITASQAGDATHSAAVDVQRLLTVNQATQTITFNALSAKTYGDADFTISASSTNNTVPITYRSLNTGIATVTGNIVHIVSAGSVSIVASQAGNTNYLAATDAPQTLTINTKALTITAVDKSKTYGAALPTLTVSYSGFITGETAGNLTTQPTISTTATAASAVGIYPITASGAVDANYSISYVAGSLTVGTKALTIIANSHTKTYGLPLPALNISYSGFVNGDDATSLSTQPTISTTATQASPVGVYPITIGGAASPNYAISYTQGILTIGTKTLTVTAVNKTKIYGAALPTLSVTYSGFVNGENASNLPTQPTISTTATAASIVGVYPITATGAIDSNYTFSYVAGTLTVNTAALTITADNQSKAYGAAMPTLTASYTGFVNGDNASSLTTAPTLVTTGTAASPKGTYPITASGAVDANYTISYVAGTLTVNPVALTITADNQSKAYGAALPTLTASYSGFVNGDTKLSLTTVPTLSTTATASSAKGTYPITASGAVDANYTISYVAGTLTVNPVALTITADNQSKAYGAALPTLTASYSGFVNGDNASSLTTAPTLSTTATASSAKGTYPITASGAVNANYTISYVAGTLTVNPVALTITADNQNKTYGAALPTLTVSYAGFVNGDNAASLTTAPTISTTATASSAVGVYPITATGAVDANYKISYVAGSLTVGTKALTIIANSHTKTYGLPLPALTINYSGFVNGDDATSLTTQPTISTTATQTSPVGVYPITVSGAASANYAITYVQGTLTIGTKTLTVTAVNKTKIYGAALPTLSVAYSGFVNGENASSLPTQPSISTTATAASIVGVYPITATGAIDSNYTFIYVAGTLTVNAAALTITADNQSKAYGAALPTLTASYTGFVNGDNASSLTTAPTISTTGTASSPKGTYPITATGAVNTNYTISYVAGTLTVNPVGLTITADNQSKAYGAALPTLTASYSGFVNGDNVASLTTAPTISTTATASSAKGTYPITASGAVDANYTISYVAGTLTVNPVALTITADNQSKAYGAALPTLTASYSGFVNGDNASSLTTAPTLGTTATASSAKGTYPITATGAVDANYTISYVAGTLTVNPVALTITADNQSKAYGAALPTLTASYSGFVNGDNASSLTTAPTLVTTGTAASPKGTYPITASGAVDANYTISYVAGTLTVNPVALTITADNQSKAYGAALPTLTASYSGFVNGDTKLSLTTAPTISTTGTASSAKGTYPITATGAVDANYTISYVAGTLTVNPVALTITADNQSKAYGAALPTLTASYSGFVNGDNASSLTTAPTLSTTGTAASPKGTYPITASGAVDANYTISYVAGTLTVNPVALTITADNQSKAYGAALPTLTASYSGFVNGDTKLSLTTAPTLSTTATASSAKGTYPITASGAVDANYTISYVAGTLTVNAVALTITADNQSKAYGAALPTLTASYSGFVNGDTKLSLTTAPTISTTATASSAKGTYPITASGAVDANYTISYVAGTLTINPVALTITADNQSKAYGAALPTLTASYSGFVNGDNASSLTTAPTLSTTGTASSAKGTYPITATGAVDANYTISYVAGTLTVNPVALTITADNQSKAYGAALPTLTASYSGFVNGDNASSLTTVPTLSTTGTAASPKGTYPITASGAVDANYTISYVAGTLTVNPVALTITADNQSKAYGAALPTLTASYSGFVNGDTKSSLTTAPTLSTSATASSAKGTYPITASGAVDANYTISYVAGTLTVNPVALTIIADNQSKAYGAALPTLTASYSGFVNGDNASSLTTAPTLSTTATASSAKGTYPITASGAVNANYTINYVPGTLTVNPVALTITADNQNKTYGAALPTLTVTYAGFVNGDNAASLTTAPTISTTATASSAVGVYPITATGAVDANYTISYVAGSLTVGTKALTITANGRTKTYGLPLPAFTVNYTGFVNGDDATSLTTQPTISTTATQTSPVGVYPITVSGAASANYAITYVQGTLTIGTKTLTVTAVNKTKIYGAALPTLSVTYSGFVNGENASSLPTQPTISTTATAASIVGVYPITATGAIDSNYTFNYVGGTLTVNAAALTITADNQSKAYGAALPTLTASYTGFVNGDNASSLTTAPTINTTGTASSPKGTYPITAAGAVNTNYTISYVAGTLTVNPVGLTITADNQSKAYGAALPTLTASYSGFVNGDNVASLTTAPTISTTATASSAKGTYPVTATGAVDANYTISYVAGTLTVNPVALTITADNQSKAYGAALPTLTASYTGFVNGDNASSLTTAPTISTTGTAASPKGTYPITATGAVDANYTISYVAGTLTVNPVALTITADNQSKAYGAALPTLTVSYSGFVNGDNASSLTTAPTISTTATASSAKGTYPITAAGAVDANYTISYVAGTLTVTPAVLTITADNQSKAYGAALPTLTVSYAGFVNGDTKTSLTSQPTVSTTGTASSPKGTYPITATGAVNANYTISYVAGTLTVNAVALTITADNQTKAYGAALPTLTVSYAGFVNGDTKTSLTTQPTVSTTGTASSPKGTYPITAAGAVNANYTISYVAGTLTVNAVTLTITADNQGKAYGAALPTLTASYSGFVNGDNASSLTTAPTLSTTATASSAKGTYPITASGAVNANYTISYVAGTLTVNPVALTITADNQTKAYGAALPTLTVSYAGFVNGDTKTSLTTQPTVSTTGTASSPKGTYPITATGAVNANYTISYVAGTLTVNPVALTITADNQSKAYGAALPTLTASYSGFVNGDNASSLTTAPTISTTATASSAKGTYPITASGAVNANYTISYVAGTLTVNPVALTITADNQTKAYGAALPTLTVSYAGFVNGDTKTSLTTQPTVSTTATASSPKGTYPITATGAVNANYTISYVAGTLTVNPVALTITADNQSKAYGAALPTLTASYSGFVNGDNASSLTTAPTISTTATASSAKGTYPITASGAVNANYTISYVAGTLTVNPVALTITADNLSKTYGAALPTLTASYTGFVNGDNASSLTTQPTLATTATAASAVGGYPITVSGAANANYTISYVAGTLTVGAKALTITANGRTKTYGVPLPTFTVNYTGFVNGDDATSLTTQPTISTTATQTSPVGVYPITVSGAVDANYAITYVPGTLTIGAKTLTITAVNKTKTYGSVLPALTVSYSGFVNGDNASALDTQPTASTTALDVSPVGTYPITVTGAVDANYSFVYVPGTLTVSTAALTITASDVNKTFGATLTGGAGSTAFTTTGLISPDSVGSVTIAYGTGAASSAGIGTYTGSVVVSAATGGTFIASNYTITYVPGKIMVTKPVITTLGALTAVSTMAGTPSAPASFNVLGANMIAGITATAPANFEVSSDNITFGNTAIIGQAGNIAATPVYVRLSGAAAVGTYSGTVVLSSTNATNVNKNMPASVVNPLLALPTLQAQQVAFTNITTSGTTISWTNGNGAGRVVFIRPGTSGTPLPANGTLYTANTTFGLGTAIGNTGWYCIYNGTGSTVDVTGLAQGTTYRVAVLEYNGTPGDAAYLETNLPPGDPNYIATRTTPANVTTIAVYPTVPARLVTFSNTTSTTTTASWTNGDGAARAAFIELTGTGSPIAIDSTTYNASTVFGVGSVLIAGGKSFYCIYNGTGNSVDITGLSPNTLYRVTVIEYQGAAGNELYLNTGQSPANVTTGSAPLYTIHIPKGTGNETPLVSSLNEEKVEANNILSPNGDGINDIWVVKNIAFYPNNTVTVYNRQGVVVFTKKGYANDWDGSYRGATLAEGSYYYLIDLGNGKTIKGFISVVNH